MRISHLGHACLLVTHGSTTVLVDPGAFSPGAARLLEDGTAGGLDAALVTHVHPDHLDPAVVPALLSRVGAAGVHAEAGALAVLREAGGSPAAAASVLAPGADLDLGDIRVAGVGGQHALIHADVPPVGNVGLLLRAAGVTLVHPGDAYDTLPEGVDVLALPLNAPWCAVKETVEFVRAVGPRLVVPIHDGLLRPERREVYLGHVRRLGGAVVHDPLVDGDLEL